MSDFKNVGANLRVEGEVVARTRGKVFGDLGDTPGSNLVAKTLRAEDDGRVILMCDDDNAGTALGFTITLGASTQRIGWRVKLVVAETLGTTTITTPASTRFLGAVVSLDTDTSNTLAINSSDENTDKNVLTLTTALPGSWVEIVYGGTITTGSDVVPAYVVTGFYLGTATNVAVFS